MWRMCKEKGMVKETGGEGEDQTIEASGDAIIISQGLFAIAQGLTEIARAVKGLDKDMNEENYGEPEESTSYLDGTVIK